MNTEPTREELESQLVDLQYAQITSDYTRMTNFVWDNLAESAANIDDDTLRDLIDHYSSED